MPKVHPEIGDISLMLQSDVAVKILARPLYSTRLKKSGFELIKTINTERKQIYADID